MALAQGEASRREQNRISRALTEAQLPYGKSWTNFEFDHIPSLNPAAIMEFSQTTHWLESGSNILIFGPSGTGKTHVSSALGTSIVELGETGEVCHGHSVGATAGTGKTPTGIAEPVV
ncbi:ATP-binding protein (plasmid) [Acaryochloris sp. 'Moss Beach']|nr:ATP-binding protein [Acaryochloris sp. 'Moss Beach']UJB73295.1 ATP-binding protein [Acaryochloris sp. 'Moss Beach']